MNVDVSAIEQFAEATAAIVVSGVGSWALGRLAAWTGAKLSAQQTASFEDAVQKALAFGFSTANGIIKAKGWDHIDVQNQVVAVAADYAVSKFPGVLTAVGIAPDGSSVSRGMVIDALNRAFPAAATTAAASPSTPPAPPTTAPAPTTPTAT